MGHSELIHQLNNYRRKHHIFQQSIDQRSDDCKAVTYDGPPFASGTPHFGHGLVLTMKDTVGRYKTMQGYKVPRNRGRDCHGLPVEKYVEKKLGLNGKKDIEKLGVKQFIEECRKSVQSTSDERRWFVDHVGRRVDMDNAYFTMDLDFMESVMYVFSSLYQQNLVYKGFKVQGYCPSCATGLANNEINEGYQDRQDPAITVKFQLYNKKHKDTHEHTDDGFTEIVAGVLQKDNKYLLIHHVKENMRVFPGGKVDAGEDIYEALHRERKEETGTMIQQANKIGTIKIIHNGKPYRVHYFAVSIDGEPTIQETHNHTDIQRAEKGDSDNELGFCININNTIIDDVDELRKDFIDFVLLEKQIITLPSIETAPMYFLARTTTPRTLSSNKFLAVGEDIMYSIIFDKKQKAYYILAKNLVKKYYKDQDDYVLIFNLPGRELVDLTYEPIFPYITHADIPEEHLNNMFHVLPADFVTTDDGTGIVHLAPFGEDDFAAFTDRLPKDKANEWLFAPVNEYGEFTDIVTDRAGTRVYDANKDIIQKLKDENKLIKHETHDHSYPHCRRCDTPLIYTPITSRFIKEQALATKTLPGVEDIHFVPETVKNRFRDTLQSAPDWNVSRNRYRGAPLPIWEAENDPEQRIVINNLDELFYHTKTGSQNLTRNILLRHGRTDYNEKGRHDGYGHAKLNEIGKQQAQELSERLTNLLDEDKDFVVVLSPLPRILETIMPFLEQHYTTEQIQTIKDKHAGIYEKYQRLYDQGEIQSFTANRETTNEFQLADNIFIDFRIAEYYMPDHQDTYFDDSTLQWNDQSVGSGESTKALFTRVQQYIQDINHEHKGKTIITVSHGEPTTMMVKAFRDFDYDNKQTFYYPENVNMKLFYRDNDRDAEVDLHKPYVDTYRFVKDGQQYHRVPEVLDCWFESGSMPYGQAHHLGNKDEGDGVDIESKMPFLHPADYIIEGLDQTRGRFRTLHVLGYGIMHDNTYKNVIINGLVLAEDGKKMSKKLKNYPDPAGLFDRYGTDAYRLYLLASPAVRSEPVRFTEKGVDQIYKDFTSSLTNAFNFFATYAKVDNFTYTKSTRYYINEKDDIDDNNIVPLLLRLGIDEIITINDKQNTATRIQKLYKQHINKDIIITNTLDEKSNTTQLIIGNDARVSAYRHEQYGKTLNTQPTNILPLPNYTITNDLDRRILAELHEAIHIAEKYMDDYQLDGGAKAVLGFMDKLTNRYIRRSRRRFWAQGMDADKSSAYHTLFTVLETYCKFAASFAPFITEHIWLQLQGFTEKHTEGHSVHLQGFPVYAAQYTDKILQEEIALVRQIISLGLFVRSQHNIKIKQPLQTMHVQTE